MLKYKQRQLLDISGQTFGALMALWIAGKTRASNGSTTWWSCQCDCGNVKALRVTALTSGNSKSCGCKHPKELHGMTKTPEYRAYQAAKERCTNKSCQVWGSYGGRGIEFLFESFAQFMEWVGDRPGKQYSLDRIDGDGHYEPGNCRWATKKEQRASVRRPRGCH